MNGYYSRQPRFWRGLSLAIGLTGVLLWPSAVSAQDATRERNRQERTKQEGRNRQANNQERNADEPSNQRPEQPLAWARIDYILNRVRFVPRRAKVRAAVVSDVLGVGDALQTLENATAELRFNDGSEARIGERALFRFTPNTRNFQLSNGTALLLIPPGRGRTTIQTPNAVTGIQGSALFVRYIEESDTTIVGALTDNPDGPMTLFTEDGSQQQALYANQVAVVEGDRITDVYELDGREFWETSGLAESFDYEEDVGPATDQLNGVRQEIREALENQEFDDSNAVENPPEFSRPETDVQATESETESGEAVTEDPVEDSAEEPAEEGTAESSEEGSAQSGGAAVEEQASLTAEAGDSKEPDIEYEGSPAENYHNQTDQPGSDGNEESTPLPSVAATEAENEDEDEPVSASGDGDRPNNTTGQSDNDPPTNTASDRPVSRPNTSERPATSNPPATSEPPATIETTVEEVLIDDPVLAIPDSESTEILSPPIVGNGDNQNPAPVAQPNEPTGGVTPLPPAALTEGEDDDDEPMMEEPDNSSDGNEDEPVAEESDNGTVDSEESTEDTVNEDVVDEDTVTDDPVDDSVDPIDDSVDNDPAETPSEDENSDELTGSEESTDGPIVGETDGASDELDDVDAVDPVESVDPPVAEDAVGEEVPAVDEDATNEEVPVVDEDATLNNSDGAEADVPGDEAVEVVAPDASGEDPLMKKWRLRLLKMR